jgi:hypothetical protein
LQYRFPDMSTAAAQALQPGASAASKAMGYLAASEVFRIFAKALEGQSESAEALRLSQDALGKAMAQGKLMLGSPP